jgi:hypothetical protein
MAHRYTLILMHRIKHILNVLRNISAPKNAMENPLALKVIRLSHQHLRHGDEIIGLSEIKFMALGRLLDVV